MTNEEAIKILKDSKITYIAPNGKKLSRDALNMAIKALQDIDFLTFLMNNINKNELEAYFSMYRAINEIKESEEEE